MDARVGGHYKFHAVQKGFESTITGEIVELVPGKKISYTSDWKGIMPNGELARPDYRSGDAALVTWTLEELPDGKTRVTLEQSGINPKYWPGASVGLDYLLQELAKHSLTQHKV